MKKHPEPYLNLYTVFSQHVRERGHKMALRAEGESITYLELDQKANQVAGFLLTCGIKKGEIIGLYMDLSLGYVAALLGVLKAGGVFMPLGKQTPSKRLQQMLNDSHPVLVLGDETIDFDWSGIPFQVYQDLEPNQVQIVASNELELPILEVAQQDPLYIFHTSGSTGTPKAIVGRHQSLYHFLAWESQQFGLDESLVVGALTPTTFDPSLRDLFLPLFVGGTLVISSPRKIDFSSRAAWLVDEGIQLIHAVPSVFDKLMDELLVSYTKEQLALTHILFAGEALHSEKLEAWAKHLPDDIQLVNLYGPTETTLAKFFHVVTPADVKKGGIVSLGKGLPDTAIFILDQNRQPLPEGHVGEIAIQTPHATLGYLKPELNAAHFIQLHGQKELVYKTGDLGKVNSSGDLEYHGRIDFQIKINGIRIEMHEIESTLLKHPSITNSVLVYHRFERGVEPELLAFIQVEKPVDDQELKVFLKAYLPMVMIPARYITLDEFPRNANGKIDRKQLLELLVKSDEPTTERNAAEMSMSVNQQTIHDLWAEVLKKEHIGLTDNFFEIGGHSLNALVIISKVFKVYGVRFEIGSFFDHPTIESFCGYLESLLETETSEEEVEIPRIPKQAFYAVSDAQRRMYLLHEITGNSSVYNIQGAYTIDGAVDVGMLQAALEKVVARHESLRTNFIRTNNGEVQQIIRGVEIPNIGLKTETILEEEPCQTYLEQKFNDPFNLETDHLLRVGLIQREEQRHILYFCMHHIISDGWSLEVFLKELLKVYTSLEQHRAIKLPALRIQYKDYVAWQLEQTSEVSEAKNYWINRMGNELPVLNFPLSFQRPAVQTYPGDTLTTTIPKKVVDGLKHLSEQYKASYFTGLLTTLYTFLHRYTGQDDFIVGSPVTCRDHSDLDHQIGLFVNTIPLRAQISPEENFRTLFQKVKQVIAEGTQHRLYPFDRLVEELGNKRDLSRGPLFDIMVNFQTKLEKVDLNLHDQLAIQAMEFPQTRSKFDFSFYFFDQGERTELRLIYNTDLFTRGHMQRVMQHFMLLAERAISQVETPLLRLDYLSDSEKQQLLSEFNRTENLPIQKQSLVGYFKECLAQYAHQPAIYSEQQTVTYQELEQKSNQLSRYLSGAYQVGCGDRVLLSLDRGPWLIVSILAALKSGASYIPTEKDTPAKVRETILHENQCKAVIDDEFLLQFEAHASEYTAEPTKSISEDNPVVAILYTTGSTGEPKGIIIRESNVLNRLVWMWNAYPFASGEVSCLKTQINFVDHIWELFGPLLKGVPTVSFYKSEVLDVPRFMKKLGHYEVSRMVLVPSLLKLLLADPQGCKTHLSKLLYWTSSGEVLPTKLVQEFYQIFDYQSHKLLNVYGSTEVTADATSFDTSEYYRNKATTQRLFDLNLHQEMEKVLQQVDEQEAVFEGGELETILARFKTVDFSTTFSKEEYSTYLTEELVPNLINLASRKFIGHMTGPIPDFIQNMSRLVTRLNQNLVKVETSLAGTLIEMEVVNYFHKAIYQKPDGFYNKEAFNRDNSLGIFTNGGSISNITALHNALNNCLPATTGFEGLAKEGLPAALRFYGYQKVALLGSRWCHYSVDKALKLFGLGTQAFEELILDQGTEEEIRAGIDHKIQGLREQKILILGLVGVAGTTESGQIEPLELLGEIAWKHQIYYHVDAAFGGAYLFSPKYRQRFQGIHHADSVTICAHKQLYMPIGTSLCLFRESDFVLNSENNTSYQARKESYDLGKFTIEGTRNFNALIVHGLLKVFGGEQIGQLLEYNKKTADSFAELIQQHQSFELIYHPDLNIVLYRYVPQALRTKNNYSSGELDQINQWNRSIQKRQFEGGKSFVSYTSITDKRHGAQEMVVFRTVFLNPNTSKQDLAEVLQEQLNLAFELEQKAEASINRPEKIETNDLVGTQQLAGTCIGRPISNVKVFLLDPYLQLVPIGVEGEICIAGESVSEGYLGDEELTQDKFIAHPLFPGEKLFRTGDIGKWTSKGEIIFAGRKDHQYKIRGNRVNTIYVEEVIAQIQGVDQAVVLAEDSKLIAFLTISEGFDITTFREVLKERIPGYMIPGEIIQIQEFPTAANGKIDRKQLNRETGVLLLGSTGNVQPSSALDQEVLTIWEKVLGQKRLSVEDDFFALGGHSLNITQLILRYKKVFGVQLEVQTLFVHTTISAHANLIGAVEEEKADGIQKVQDRPYYPVSDGQRRIWSLNQYINSTTAFHITGAVIIREKVSSGSLQEAILALIQRHESIRTNFVKDDVGAPKQVVRSMQEVDFQLEVQDATDQDEAFVRTAIEAAFRQSFDLEKDLLFRAILIQQAEDEFVFGYCLHHINGDAISMDLLLQDLLRAYVQQEDQSIEPQLPLDLQYRDYAVWEQQQKQERSETQKAEFANTFRDSPRLQLPKVFKRPLVKSYEGETLYYDFPEPLFALLKEKSKAYETTIFSLVTAGLNGLFYRYTNQEDLLLGMTSDLRAMSGMNNQVGFLVNTLPVRTQLNPDAGFRTLGQKAHENVIKSFEFQTYALDDLLDEINYQRDSSHSPLFDVVINFESKELSKSPLKVRPFDFDKGTAQFDLTFGFKQTSTGIAAKIEFNTSLYDRAAVERIAAHYCKFLRAGLSADEEPLYALDYLLEDEKKVNCVARQEKRWVDPSLKTILDFFDAQVAQGPDRNAVCYRDQVLSYAELDQLSKRLAIHLQSRATIKRGDFVGIKLKKSEYLIASIFAIIRLGAAYVPIDPDFPEDRIRFMKEDSGCQFVLDAAELEFFLQKEPTSESLEKVHASETDPAYIIYTSGTTGKPKGVVIEHANLTNMFFHEDTPFDFEPSDVWSLFHSQCFDFSVWEIFGPLLTGGSVVVIDKETARNPILVKRELEEKAVTILSQTPSAFYLLTREFQANPAPHHIKQVYFGGEALSSGQLSWWTETFPEVQFFNLYGTTESTIHATYKIITPAEVEQNSCNIGIALPGYEAYVLGKKLELLPFGVEGELVIGGKGLSDQYLNDASLTREKYIDHLWSEQEGAKLYRTGDVVKKIPGGEMIYIGRMDRQVKIRGHRIELAEIEQVLNAKAEIFFARLTTQIDKEGQRELLAFIQSTVPENVNTLVAFLKRHVPQYMIPLHYVQFDELVLNANGKLDEKYLKAHNAPLTVDQQVLVPPRKELDQKVLAIWQEVLNLEELGIDNNLFEIGGNSLKAIQIVGALNKAFDVELNLAALFGDFTIRHVADEIEKIQWFTESQHAVEADEDMETETFSI